MNRGYRVPMIFLISAWIAGCGLATERIRIGYQPQEGITPIAGSSGVQVRVEVSDLRSNKDELSKKGDEYSFLAPILAENDIAETLKEAIRSELERRGFVADGAGPVVRVELSKFYNRFLSSTSEAELFMHVQVQKPGGDLQFSTIVQGQGVESGVALRSGNNAKAALEAALRDAVYKLMTDIRFTDALVAAGKRNEIPAKTSAPRGED